MATKKAKHTPGPWVAWVMDDGAYISAETNAQIAWVNADTIDERNQPVLGPEGKASALLIAAAPDLADALVDLLTGGSKQNPGGGPVFHLVGAEDEHLWPSIARARVALEKAGRL